MLIIYTHTECEKQRSLQSRDNVLLCKYQLYTHKFSLTNGGVLRDPHVMFLYIIVILYTQKFSVTKGGILSDTMRCCASNVLEIDRWRLAAAGAGTRAGAGAENI